MAAAAAAGRRRLQRRFRRAAGEDHHLAEERRCPGLGRALPAGRVRVFDGGDFLGESMLAHTPRGVAIHLETGTAFDLTAERRRDGFRSIAPGAA